MLIIIIGLSYYLVRDMNEYLRKTIIGTETIDALSEAKNALKAWAINHPFNPGTLPMPDRNSDGNYDGDSDCYNGPAPIGNNLLLGRLPWKGFPAPCKDAASISGLNVFLRDSSGEQLWYAVSKNLVYESPDYPNISPDILDKTSDWIKVRDANGNVISDRVAFVVISPGSPVGNQNRSGTAPAAGEYLDSVTIAGTTYSNSDFDQDFIIYPNSKLTTDPSDSFNDQLVFVTIDELMEGVSRRVINETGNFLAEYHNNYGAFPWLSPYADPKALAPVLTGAATSGGVNALNDSDKDFTAAGVTAGDVVRNITDGSVGIVATVGTDSLTVSSLVLGADNDFDEDDIYYIDRLSSTYITTVLRGAADAGSSGNTLVDSGQDFINIGIRSGDIVENISDDSSGIIADVTATTLTVRSLSGGTGNDFVAGDIYQIRTNMGQATAGSSGLTLMDSNTDFQQLGVRAGDIIRNITDGSVGIVDAVPVADTLTVSGLILGSENDFDPGDDYIISRFRAEPGTTEGLLAFHRQGGMFDTDFTVDWDLQAANNVLISTTPATLLSSYVTKITTDIETPSAGINVDAGEGYCVWMKEDFVECYGNHDAGGLMLSGLVTSGNNTATFTDSTQNFTADGVKKGDLIQNYDDESNVLSGTADAGSNGTTLIDNSTDFSVYLSSGLLYNYLVINNTQTTAEGVDKIQGIVTKMIDEHTLVVSPYPNDIPISFSPGDSYILRTPQTMVITNVVSNTTLTTTSLTGPNPDFDVNEYYRIKPSAGGVSGTAGPGSNNDLLIDTFDLTQVKVGDIIENVTDGSFGIINTITGTSLNANLTGGSQNKFNNGDDYNIYTSYVNSRSYEFNLRFNGNDNITNPVTGVRKRDVCLGYGSDCSLAPAATSLPYNFGIAAVSIVDYDDNKSEVARASATIQNSGSTGAIRVSDIDYYLSEAAKEIPEWFIRNKWYQYVFIRYSDGDSPGTSSACTAGTDCLVLNMYDSSPSLVASRNDVRALILYAGSELASQSRNTGAVTDYFDVTGNTDGGDDNYDKMLKSATFNDLFRIAITCSSDPTELCWSE